MTAAFPRWCLTAATILLLAAPAAAQSPLPLGAPAAGKATGDEPAEYTVVAKSPGVVSVAVNGTGDLAIQLLDEDGQQMPDGSADRDMNGSPGTEVLSVTVGEAGTYRVRVRVQGGDSSSFQIAGSFLGFPDFGRPSDPDRRPGQARAVQVGKPHDDSLDPAAGDSWDWFVFKAGSAGSLVVITRPLADTSGDLVLEVFTDGDFARPVDRSDQDMQGNGSNESSTVTVTAGQTVHVKVSTGFSGAAKYRLSSSIIE